MREEQNLDPDDIEGCSCGALDTVEVAYDRIQHQTDKAVLFIAAGEDVWIPKSCIVSIGENDVVVSRWFAEKEGL